ncbi:universal stress protein [Allofustis seminis]|uniref:universal stress protein n=1 Tax=Allofustis seminis TaxID=166939 RepID=UPI00036C6171|nr:universal stress protein [Allofustis seminis]
MLREEYKNILVAVDGSKASRVAFQKAALLTVQNRGTLFIAHVIDERSFTHTDPSYAHYDNQISMPKSAQEDPLQAVKITLNEYKKLAEKYGIYDCQILIEYGNPEKVIAKKLPKEYGIDLIIMGATGLSAVERLFIGSVSESVIRHAICDVLIVRKSSSNLKHSAEEGKDTK